MPDECQLGCDAVLTGSCRLSRVKYTATDDTRFVPERGNHFVTIFVAEVNKPSMNALQYARLLGGRVVAVHILLDSRGKDLIEEQWKLLNVDIPLLILGSPSGSIVEPLTEFVAEISKSHKGCVVTLLLPVIAGLTWWQRFLHNQTERLIERAFQNRAGVVTIRIQFFLAGPGRNISAAPESHAKKM
jgi:hypothetical protein